MHANSKRSTKVTTLSGNIYKPLAIKCIQLILGSNPITNSVGETPHSVIKEPGIIQVIYVLFLTISNSFQSPTVSLACPGRAAPPNHHTPGFTAIVQEVSLRIHWGELQIWWLSWRAIIKHIQSHRHSPLTFPE